MPERLVSSESPNRLYAPGASGGSSLWVRGWMEARDLLSRMLRTIDEKLIAPLRGLARGLGASRTATLEPVHLDPATGTDGAPRQRANTVRLVTISCIKNEIDIVEAFVRHTLALADHLVVLDNGSTDGTLDVLRSLEREGLALEIVEDPSPGHWQWKRMTRLMKDFAVARHAADWVLPLDSDEFLLPPPDGGFSELLARHTEPLNVSWRTYVPDPTDDPAEPNPAVRMSHRLEREARVWQKVLVPRRLAGRPGATLSQGNHKIMVSGRSMRGADLSSTLLAHFPIRSPGQYAAKVVLVKLQHLAMSERDLRWGWHHDAAYDLLKGDPEAFSATWRDSALRFAVEAGAVFEPRVVLDPMPYRGGALAYTPSVNDGSRPLRLLLEYAESLARLHAEHERTS